MNPNTFEYDSDSEYVEPTPDQLVVSRSMFGEEVRVTRTEDGNLRFDVYCDSGYQHFCVGEVSTMDFCDKLINVVST